MSIKHYLLTRGRCDSIAPVTEYVHPQIDLYPVTIRQARYSGAYEGGQWVCFGSSEILPEEAFGDDAECAWFWSSPSASLVGVGSTPNEALYDMMKRLGRIDTPITTYKEIVSQFENNVQARSHEGGQTHVSLRGIRLERTNYFDASTGFAFDSE